VKVGGTRYCHKEGNMLKIKKENYFDTVQKYSYVGYVVELFVNGICKQRVFSRTYPVKLIDEFYTFGKI